MPTLPYKPYREPPEPISPEMQRVQAWAKDEKRIIADAAAERERAKRQHTGWKPDVWTVPYTPPVPSVIASADEGAVEQTPSADEQAD